MEIQKKNFNLKIGESVNIYFLGDIHEGNCNHADKEFRQAVKIIEADESGYWVGMGDYIEAITISDKRFDPMSVSQDYRIKDLKDLPYIQIQNVYNKLKPIDSKCLALLIGNHEEAYVKYNHADVYNRFFEMFESEPRKIGYVGFVKLGFTRYDRGGNMLHTRVIAVNHGDGGSGMREGYPVNKVHDVFRWADADICVMGHIHQLCKDSKKMIGVTNKDTLSRRWKFWGSSGCFLYTYVEGNKNYFEAKGRAESKIGMLKATIEMRHDELFTQLTEIELG